MTKTLPPVQWFVCVRAELDTIESKCVATREQALAHAETLRNLLDLDTVQHIDVVSTDGIDCLTVYESA